MVLDLSITWELVKNANSAPDLLNQKLGNGVQQTVSTNLPSPSETGSSLRTITLSL